MVVAGMQPLSLLDYPGKPCSILFTQGCIFRCSFCHNPDLIPLQSEQEPLNEDSIFEKLNRNKKIIDAVCITGGEPTIQQGLVDFITRLKNEGFFVKLDTSGVRPDIVKELLSRSLVDYIAMDLKNAWERYSLVTTIGNELLLHNCKTTFSLIQQSGVPHEFRTTILPGIHGEKDFFEICSYLTEGESYFIQETNFKKTLDPNISRVIEFSALQLVDTLRANYPSLRINLR